MEVLLPSPAMYFLPPSSGPTPPLPLSHIPPPPPPPPPPSQADKLLSMDYQHALDKLISFLPTDRQILLFSATFPVTIRGFTVSPPLLEPTCFSQQHFQSGFTVSLFLLEPTLSTPVDTGVLLMSLWHCNTVCEPF